MIKVSVILTTYNSEKTLQGTIDSVFNQVGLNSLFEIELIVVDDCSKDGTVAVLNQNHINYFTTWVNSGGPNKGRNIGLKKATGKFICFIDHDDVWEPDKIMLQLKIAEEFPIISTGHKIVDSFTNKTILRGSDLETPVVYKQNETFLRKLKKENSGQNVYFSTLMINSELKNIFFEEVFGMIDYDWILRLFENRTSAEIPKCLVTRYVNSENLSLNNDYRRKDFYYSLYTLENYQERYLRETEKGMKHLNGTRARYFYLQNNMKAARKYFWKSEVGLKDIAFILTTFYGSRFVKKNFNFFG